MFGLRLVSLPRTGKDRVAFSFFVLGCLVAYWFEVRVVLPTYYPHWCTMVYVHYACATGLIVYVYANLLGVLSQDAGRGHREFPASLQPGWRYCYPCESVFPPRSYHCPACDRCILRRDHHCWFTGCCIGWGNHRYYLVMILFLWIGGIYGNAFHYQFVVKQIGGFSIGSVFRLIFPQVGLMFGYYTFAQFLFSILILIAALLLILITWLIQIQVTQIWRGQTRYEHSRKITDFDLGIIGNLREILGEHYLLVFIWPLAKSPLYGNGMQFLTKYGKTV